MKQQRRDHKIGVRSVRFDGVTDGELQILGYIEYLEQWKRRVHVDGKLLDDFARDLQEA